MHCSLQSQVWDSSSKLKAHGKPHPMKGEEKIKSIPISDCTPHSFLCYSWENRRSQAIKNSIQKLMWAQKIQITNARVLFHSPEESRKLRLLLNTDFPLIELQTEFSVTTRGVGGFVAGVYVFVGRTHSSLRLFSVLWGGGGGGVLPDAPWAGRAAAQTTRNRSSLIDWIGAENR